VRIGYSTVGGTTFAITATDIVRVCAGHSLNLTSATFSANTLVFDSASTPGGERGTWGGTLLKFGAGNKQIANYNPSLPSIALNISSMTTGDTIYTDRYGYPIIFSSVTGGSLSCTSTGGSAVAYNPGDEITANITCTVTVGGDSSSGAVSAPIFSIQEKPAIFSEEVK